MTKFLLMMLALGLISCTSSEKGSESENKSEDMSQEQSADNNNDKAPENETQHIPIGSVIFEGTPESAVSDEETSVSITISKVIGYGSQIPRISTGKKTFIVPEGALSVREKLSEHSESETYRFMALYREDMSGATWTLQEVIE